MSRFGVFVFFILFVTASCLPENESDPKSASPFFLVNRLCSPSYINNVQLKQLICLVCKIFDPSCSETATTTTEGQTASITSSTSSIISTTTPEQKIETTTIKQTTKEEQAETEE
ncbi:uncharacterized protein LOC133319333 [Danaus plexippus]|uniref:uncharacterized protein LOC133319333 n=1 Tax=Danaus plexippus TaxID=13037 RepID=UPI002AB22124|nr:uncharacterized protein LOC133319333 [Danaus plexippus]